MAVAYEVKHVVYQLGYVEAFRMEVDSILNNKESLSKIMNPKLFVVLSLEIMCVNG